MFTSITWLEYAFAVLVALFIYYTIIAFIYYKNKLDSFSVNKDQQPDKNDFDYEDDNQEEDRSSLSTVIHSAPVTTNAIDTVFERDDYPKTLYQERVNKNQDLLENFRRT